MICYLNIVLMSLTYKPIAGQNFRVLAKGKQGLEIKILREPLKLGHTIVIMAGNNQKYKNHL